MAKKQEKVVAAKPAETKPPQQISPALEILLKFIGKGKFGGLIGTLGLIAIMTIVAFWGFNEPNPMAFVLSVGALGGICQEFLQSWGMRGRMKKTGRGQFGSGLGACMGGAVAAITLGIAGNIIYDGDATTIENYTKTGISVFLLGFGTKGAAEALRFPLEADAAKTSENNEEVTAAAKVA